MIDSSKISSNSLTNIVPEGMSKSDLISAHLMALISSAITSERIKRGLSQKDFAKLLGVKQSQVSLWERGDYNFTIQKIAAIASALDKDISFSMEDIKKKKKATIYYGINFSVSHKKFSQKFKTISHFEPQLKEE